MAEKSRIYGKELILDLHECDPSLFTREYIGSYFENLCKLIQMKPADLHFWDDLDTPPEQRQTEPHLKGTSAIQFIMTSNVTIHTLDELKAVYINIFSCKDFNEEAAAGFSEKFFMGRIVQKLTVERK